MPTITILIGLLPSVLGSQKPHLTRLAGGSRPSHNFFDGSGNHTGESGNRTARKLGSKRWSGRPQPAPSVKGFQMIGEVEGLPRGRHGEQSAPKSSRSGARSCITHVRDPVLVGSNLQMH